MARSRSVGIGCKWDPMVPVVATDGRVSDAVDGVFVLADDESLEPATEVENERWY